MRDNMQMSSTVSADGITMNMVVAIAGDDFRMLFDLDTAALDLYVTSEMVYAKTVMQVLEKSKDDDTLYSTVITKLLDVIVSFVITVEYQLY